MKKARARDLGISLPGTPGEFNAITDVPGVEVGYSTILLGQVEDYKGPGSPFARTGVTAILPRGKRKSTVFAGLHDLNGNGEMTGTHWVNDSGFLHGPVMITNTNSVGIVRDTTAKWMLENRFFEPLYSQGREMDVGFFYPVVGETWDGTMNDTEGFHVKAEHVLEALESAHGGFIPEGNVGGGTGMLCHGFKGGTGTASRVLSEEDGGYTVGVLVQANHGRRENLTVSGVPVGKILTGYTPINPAVAPEQGTGSIIVVVATNAPVWPMQLSKMCRRVSIGIGRVGGGYSNSSGDIFIAFSTANENAYTHTKTTIEILGDERMDPLYKAVADATEEAILNALCAAETMTGKKGDTYFAMPGEQVAEMVKAAEKLWEAPHPTTTA